MNCPVCNTEMGYDHECDVQWLKCNKCGHKLYLSENSPRQIIINFLKNRKASINSEIALKLKSSVDTGVMVSYLDTEASYSELDVLSNMLRELEV